MAAGMAACSGASTDAGAETGPVANLDAPRPFGPLELVLLGTKAGPPIVPSRAGISTALVVDGATYLIDCGRSSTTQFARAGLRFDGLRSIFITHLHADHIADYYNYFLLAGSIPNQETQDALPKTISVFGPGPAGGLPAKFGGGEVPTVAAEDPTPGLAALTDKCHDAFAYSTNVFLRDTGIRDIRTLVDVHEIALPEVGASFANTSPRMDPFPVMEDDHVAVTAILVPHGPVFPSFAFRFDTAHGSVTFSGDTTYSDNLVALAQGSDVLVHEAINLQGPNVSLPPAAMDHMLQSHVEVQKVGAIARKAGVRRLVLTHLSDFDEEPLDPARWQKWAEQDFDGEVVIADDLQRIPIQHFV
jgi:ribonuclease BN (tRNA processing enzyme)